VITQLKALSEEYKDVSLLARTHGQPASPTRLGKEFAVFINRLEEQRKTLLAAAKFGGATGKNRTGKALGQILLKIV